MAFLKRVSGIALEAFGEFKAKGWLTGVKDTLRRLGSPRRWQRYFDGATRTGQIVAFLLLGPLIMVNLALIVSLNQVMTGVFGMSDYDLTQGGIVGWLITAITGGAFLMSAYIWFQWVRTAGFGWFTLD